MYYRYKLLREVDVSYPGVLRKKIKQVVFFQKG